MHLAVEQRFAGTAAARVAAAYADPRLYAELAELPFGGNPSVVDRRVDDGEITMAVRYRIEANLPSVARMFVDPDKLTFIEYATYKPDGSGTFDIVPDHYSRQLQAFGTIEIEPGATCVRRLTGELRVELGMAGMMFEDQAERQIGDGLRMVLQRHVPVVEKFAATTFD